jgi:dTDP-4-amino-4,6-dideoxygalactose transaminase
MTIQLFVPTFDIESCLEGIRECLDKGWTGLGFKTVEFEAAWKAYTGLPHAHFLSSATSGLHLALDVLMGARGWSRGEGVLTTPLTFVSTNHAILHAGLEPVFVDVDRYLCLDPDDFARKISRHTRAAIFVGLGGSTGALDRIREICRRNDIVLVLDAAHMAGTKMHGETPRADVIVYSYQAVKNLPTADSGMICFADARLDAIARKKSWLGINRNTYERASDSSTYKWRYDVEFVGFKYHGNSIMAAIALAQLPHLDAGNERRRAIAARYDAGFAHNDRIERIPIPAGCSSARHLYQIAVDRRDDVLDFLAARGINAGVHYRNNLDYPMYAAQRLSCPRAARQSARLLSLPLHLRLADEDVQRVIDAVNACTLSEIAFECEEDGRATGLSA